MAKEERITVKKCIYCNKLFEGDRNIEDICLSCKTAAKAKTEEDIRRCGTGDSELFEDKKHDTDGFFNL